VAPTVTYRLGIVSAFYDTRTEAERQRAYAVEQPWLYIAELAWTVAAAVLTPGAHITTVGPDEPGKCEVDAGVIVDGLFVCDDRDLAVTMGAVGGAGLGPEAIDAELGEIIAGARPGRTNAGQTTIYGGVGLAFQDLAAAWHVYRAARAADVGRGIDFLS